MMNYLYLATNIVLLVSGQILFKIGLNQAGGFNLNNLVKTLVNPYILLGLSLYAFATLIWFVVLSRMPLSTAYPIQSMAYVLGVAAALIIFNEPVSPLKWIGTGVIILGVVLISFD